MNEWTSMLAYRVKGQIEPDRTLTVQLPPDAPPGEYEIILLYPDPRASDSAIEGSSTRLPEDRDQRLDNKGAE
jgi:hypothetical protein